MKYKIYKIEQTYCLCENGEIIDSAHEDNILAMRSLIDKYIELTIKQ